MARVRRMQVALLRARGRLLDPFRKGGFGFAIGSLVLMVLVFAAIAAPLVAPYDPLEQHYDRVFSPPGLGNGVRPAHLLGTDALGRDTLSRIIYGARTSLAVGAVAVIACGAIGTLLGLAAGYWSGALDAVTMRLVDIQLSVPFILLAIVIVALFGPSLPNLILVLILSGWVIYARTVRGEVMKLKELPFVEGARALGLSNSIILFRHILPSVLPSVVVIASLQVGTMILIESGLSFLGLGVRPPQPTWGNMLGEGRAYLQYAWWMTTFPGIAISITVVAVNLVADGIRKAYTHRTLG